MPSRPDNRVLRAIQEQIDRHEAKCKYLYAERRKILSNAMIVGVKQGKEHIAIAAEMGVNVTALRTAYKTECKLTGTDPVTDWWREQYAKLEVKIVRLRDIGQMSWSDIASETAMTSKRARSIYNRRNDIAEEEDQQEASDGGDTQWLR